MQADDCLVFVVLVVVDPGDAVYFVRLSMSSWRTSCLIVFFFAGQTEVLNDLMGWRFRSTGIISFTYKSEHINNIFERWAVLFATFTRERAKVRNMDDIGADTENGTVVFSLNACLC